MLEADEAHHAKTGEPLFSSHMLDLSEESKEENIEICKKYLARMAKIGIWLEMEIGITGGEEDGVNNENVDNASLYTQPEDIWDIYREFSEITPNFSIAAGFGNVHVSIVEIVMSIGRMEEMRRWEFWLRTWDSCRKHLGYSLRQQSRQAVSFSKAPTPPFLTLQTISISPRFIFRLHRVSTSQVTSRSSQSF